MSEIKYILVHYHEIALKGKNRPIFEERLVRNIKKTLGGHIVVKRLSGRIEVRVPETEIDEALKKMGNVFGVSGFSPAIVAPSDLKEIKKSALQLLSGTRPPQVKKMTFKVATKRGFKQFPKNSMEISSEVGAYILEKTPHPSFPPLEKGDTGGFNNIFVNPPHASSEALAKEKPSFSKGGGKTSRVGRWKVDVKKPQITINIELLKDRTYIYTEKIKGQGGLPVGVSGKMLVLISGGIDSPVASYLMAKRGAELFFLHFHSYPYTDKASIEKVHDILHILSDYGINEKNLYLAPIIDFQKEAVKKVNQKHRVIIYRRLMYKVAEELAKKIGAKALVSGDNLGQVASQTIENMAVIGADIHLPIMRPLVGFDKEEIIDLAKKIGTFEISIIPHGDCCTVFLPKSPATKARIGDIIMEEKNIGMEGWVGKIIKEVDLHG
ncbi:tRNA 4-thiouridine(8) synthase ThiI [Candidatus Parcubacteria bacterium]|nr:tRNA 4-thiouridine(8) synthase ThiI [Patescibacteria group bacterium]MCG2693683.1 tRNA 4-thiouridine(8) synthase ThiI [Candidatus Parcubacteria bacterium]